MLTAFCRLAPCVGMNGGQKTSFRSSAPRRSGCLRLDAGLAVFFSMLTFLTARADSTNCVITGFSPSAAAAGASVAISGTNFSADLAGNIVYFGAVRAQVSAASVTNLTVTVPAGAVYGPITATVNGRTAYSSSAFVPTFDGAGLPVDGNTFAPSFDLSADNGPIQVV